MNTGIYLIINVISGCVYIGSTSDGFEVRFTSHRNALLRGDHDNEHLQRSWYKYGESVFEFYILEPACPKKCLEVEQYWIDWFRDWLGWDMLYNINKNASNRLGMKHSAEAKEKISKNHQDVSGENNPMFGKKHTKAAKKKIAEKAKGRVFTEETRKKMSENSAKNFLGKHHTEESKKKLSEALKGRALSIEHRRKMSLALRGEKNPSYKKEKYRVRFGVKEKFCIHCKSWLEEEPNFGRNGGKGRTGTKSYCIECCRSRASMYRERMKRKNV